MNKIIAAALKQNEDNYDSGLNTLDVEISWDRLIRLQKELSIKYGIPADDMFNIEEVISDCINATREAAYEVGFKDGGNLVLDMKKPLTNTKGIN